MFQFRGFWSAGMGCYGLKECTTDICYVCTVEGINVPDIWSQVVDL